MRGNYVLTAGHCVDPDVDGRVDPPSAFRVLLGTKRRSTGGERIAVAKVVRHEQYASTPNGSGASHDVALLELTRASSLGQVIRIAGDGERDRWKPGTQATALGWGTRAPEDLLGLTAADELQQVQVPIRSDDECTSSYGDDYDPRTMLCAGELLGGRDTCQGDSGGPLQVPGADGAPLLVGAVSFGTACGLPTQYGVYARVADATLRPWIESHLPAAAAGGAGTTSSPAPATSAPSSAPIRLSLRLPRTRAGARRLVVRVSASGTVRSVRVRLSRGRRTVARGRLATLRSARRVTLRARLRAGAYRVRVTALDASGRRLTVTRSLRVRR